MYTCMHRLQSVQHFNLSQPPSLTIVHDICVVCTAEMSCHVTYSKAHTPIYGVCQSERMSSLQSLAWPASSTVRPMRSSPVVMWHTGKSIHVDSLVPHQDASSSFSMLHTHNPQLCSVQYWQAGSGLAGDGESMTTIHVHVCGYLCLQSRC